MIPTTQDDIQQQIADMLVDISSEYGVEVLEAKINLGRGHQSVRVIVDAVGGVQCGILERVSRALSLQLDVANIIPGAFHLETTTPGLNWPLSSVEDINRHKGEFLIVQLVSGQKIEGENLGANGDSFSVREDSGREQVFTFSETCKVTRGINWKHKQTTKKHRRKR
ncbi:MAG: ribosome assembly cofactor RimP [Mariprofundales bacterium]